MSGSIVECHECYNKFLEKEMINYNSYMYCKECYEKIFFTCPLCKHVRYKHEESNLKNGHCIHCIKHNEILSYYYKPCYFKSFQCDGDDGLLMGIELELGDADKYSDVIDIIKIFTNNKELYFKSDESIPSYGVEAVSFPATLQAHKTIMPWKKYFETIKGKMDSTNHCGLHCHFTRSDLVGELNVIDLFLNSNYKFFEKICGRDFNEYCHHSNKRERDWGRALGGRTAINLENDKTVEFRFCASTNNYETFIYRLEVLHSIVTFCKTPLVTFEKMLISEDEMLKDYIEYANNKYNFGFKNE